MVTLSDKEEQEDQLLQQQQQDKNGYWENELYWLGILPKQKKEEEAISYRREELENLADIIKQAMFHDYKLAYGEGRCA